MSGALASIETSETRASAASADGLRRGEIFTARNLARGVDRDHGRATSPPGHAGRSDGRSVMPILCALDAAGAGRLHPHISHRLPISMSGPHLVNPETYAAIDGASQ